MYHISAFIEYVWKPFRVYASAFVSLLFLCGAVRLVLVFASDRNPWAIVFAIPCVFLSMSWLFLTLVLMDHNEYEATIAKGELWD